MPSRSLVVVLAGLSLLTGGGCRKAQQPANPAPQTEQPAGVITAGRPTLAVQADEALAELFKKLARPGQADLPGKFIAFVLGPEGQRNLADCGLSPAGGP